VLYLVAIGVSLGTLCPAKKFTHWREGGEKTGDQRGSEGARVCVREVRPGTDGRLASISVLSSKRACIVYDVRYMVHAAWHTA
jgi:hypothetical protein